MRSNKYTRTKKKEAVKLRLRGFSYGEILKKLEIPSKGTLSVWFRNLKLPSRALKRLENNVRLAHERGLFRFNAKRSKRIAEENRQYEKVGSNFIGRLNKRELLLVGSALYWGEGTKSVRGRVDVPLSFANSDPIMVLLFMRFLREILLVEESRILGSIYTYPDMDEMAARKFWSGITGLAPERFYIHTQVSRASQGKREWNRLPHGTVSIRISGRKYFHTTMGMIKGLASNT